MPFCSFLLEYLLTGLHTGLIPMGQGAAVLMPPPLEGRGPGR